MDELLSDVQPKSLLQMVKKEQKKQSIESFFKNLSPIIISITILFFVLSLIICIVILLNSKS